MDRLTGKAAIVTGGANGIGAATAAALAREGAAVAIADLDAAGAEAVAARITSAGGKAMAVTTDIASPASVEAMVARVVADFGRIDILHNNAADTTHTTLVGDLDVVSTGLETWDRTFAVNLRGTFLVSKAVIPVMAAGGGGSIVNMSSVEGLLPTDGVRVAYSTSKAAICALTTHIAASHGKQGIRCNVLAPGTILTETHMREIPVEARERALSRALTTRLGTPADIAELVVFLASDASGYITGQVIRPDGGLLSHRSP